MNGKLRKGVLNNYTPNTAQMLKGQSLKSQNVRRKQQLQHRHCSFDRSRVAKFTSSHTPYSYNPVGRKYQGFETIDDPDLLLRFIQYQRVKQSQSSRRSIKMLSQRVPQDPKFMQSRPKTSNSNGQRSMHRILHDSTPYQTITHANSVGNTNNVFSVTNALTASPKPQSQLRFDSINLEPRLNQDINIVLRSKSKASIDITNADIKKVHDRQQSETGYSTIENQIRTIDGIGKAKPKTAGFVRQMKRNRKVRATARDSRTQQDSQLVKALMHQTARVDSRGVPWTPSERRNSSVRVGESEQVCGNSQHHQHQHSYLNDNMGIFLRRKR